MSGLPAHGFALSLDQPQACRIADFILAYPDATAFRLLQDTFPEGFTVTALDGDGQEIAHVHTTLRRKLG